MRQLSWLSLVLLAGCGGTNTTDGMSQYNRGTGQDTISPINSNQGAPSANEVLAVNAFLNATEIKDAKQATMTVDGIKKLSIPPKRIFLIGATSNTAEWFKKPLSDAKIIAVPIPGPEVKDWNKVLKAFGADKLFSNGPNMGGPNVEGVSSDQSKLNSTAVYDGVRFFFLNTDTPLKTPKPGSIARLWFLAKQGEMKENSGVAVGYRAVRALGAEDTTPVISTADILAKNSKIKLFVSSSAKTPALARPEATPYHMAVGGAIGEDRMPYVGVLEVRKNGALYSRIEKLDLAKPATATLEATIWEPSGAMKGDPKSAKDAQAPAAAKEPQKTSPKDPPRG